MESRAQERARTARRAWPAIVAVLCVVVLAATGGPVAAQDAPHPVASPEERAAALIRPAVAFVQVEWSGWVYDDDLGFLNDGDPFEFSTTCSAFVVNPSGSVVTAGHCVDRGMAHGVGSSFVELGAQWLIEEGYFRASAYEDLVEYGLMNWTIEGEAAGSPPERSVWVQWGVATAGLTTGNALQAQVVAESDLDKGDVALLKVDARNLSSALLAPETAIEIGTPVLSVGYPASAEAVTDATYEPAFKDGKISARRTRNGLPFFEMSAAMTNQDSGGPVVDLGGRVVGLNSFSPGGESQAFNMISAASTIGDMLRRNGVANELSPADGIYREALEKYFGGDYADAVAAFGRVLDLVPSHQQAQEYRQKAVERRSTEPEKSSSGLVVGAIAAGVLLLVVLPTTTAVAVRRRRRRATGPAQVISALDAASRGQGQAATAFCTVCGQQLLTDESFCRSCGVRVA